MQPMFTHQYITHTHRKGFGKGANRGVWEGKQREGREIHSRIAAVPWGA